MLGLALFLTVAAIVEPIPKLEINRDKITVSGISSGAFMAVQTHIALSDQISGVAAVAGGPYWCSENSLKHGIVTCMKNPQSISLKTLFNKLRAYEKDELIAKAENLRDDHVLILHGNKDTIVNPLGAEKTKEFYQELVNDSNILLAKILNLGHGFPTNEFGVACEKSKSPWLNKCGINGAEKILTYFYDTPDTRRGSILSNLKFLTFEPAVKDSSISPFLYAYIPQKCYSEKCPVHIAFHGCQMSTEFIGTKFIKNGGYNSMAESLGLIVLYPQILKSSKNPNGCWDWIGYTNENFANRRGLQIQVIQGLLTDLGAKE